MRRKASAEELKYLNAASQMLELPTSTWATGVVLFHRYCSFVDRSALERDPLDPHICMMLCLYLATKVTEEPRKQRDVINVGYKLAHPESEFLPVGDTLSALRDTMTRGELVLMRTLGFNVNVELPHKWIAYILNGAAWWENNGIPPDDTAPVPYGRIAP
ncbi:hypothetical protein GQ54DRAFT_303821 [Martensiomyces pterosporus]|nr:hypothetical protein GQ54DRAFT_303821 [Martensiomyces pterosporus]